MTEQINNTITTITVEGKASVIETTKIQIVPVATQGVQGAKGDGITLAISDQNDEIFADISEIKLGNNLTLVQNPDNSVTISAIQSGGTDFFTQEMDGLASTFTANHNLGRFIAVARVYQPDGEVAQVEVQNIDNEGNVSQNVAQVISSVPMVGTLTLI